MKITIEHEGITCSIDAPYVAMDDVIRMVRYSLLGVGFHPETVNEYIGD